MKIESINNQGQNFKGALSNVIVKHPLAIASIASASVIAQKIVQSTAEAGISPFMDIGIGKAISKITKEEDDRFEQSSKVQAVRSFSQTVGGTITGVAIRALCIGGATFAITQAVKNGKNMAADIINEGSKNAYDVRKNVALMGAGIGGAVATVVMLFTNFVLDAPIINAINKKTMDFFFGKDHDKQSEEKKGV